MLRFLPEFVRDRLVAWGWPPRTWVVRTGFQSLVLVAVLLALQLLLWIFGSSVAASISPFQGGLLSFALFMFAIAGFRWLKRKLLWRLRNRLIVTYVFIGVVPAVLLVAMAVSAFYLFAGQFATYVVTSGITTELRSLAASNASVMQSIGDRLRRKEAARSPALSDLPGMASAPQREVCVWSNDKPLLAWSSSGPHDCTFSLPHANSLPHAGSATSQDAVLDHGSYYLRAAEAMDVAGQRLVVISSAPLDKTMLEQVANGLGEITLYSLSDLPNPPAGNVDKPDSSLKVYKAEPGKSKLSIDFGSSSTKKNSEVKQLFSAGKLEAAASGLDYEIYFGAPLTILDWAAGTRDYGAAVKVHTRPSLLYNTLFAALGEFAVAVEIVLSVIAVLFAIIVLLALIIGTRLTRTMTRSVANLYKATQRINQGDFSHRIEVREKDQLAELQTSFNSMTASLQKLLAEQRDKQRLENELAIAQEVQAQLFPKQISQLTTLEVHGFCKPARTVSGDYYDFLNIDANRMGLAVGDVSGKGISAALLMATVHSAVRAYILEGIPILTAARSGNGHGPGVEISPSALMSLLNHQIFGTTPTEKYATMFLGLYNELDRRLTYTNAGHLPPILITENGEIRRLETGGTVVGLFEQVCYDESSVTLQPGEIFLAYSDGVTEPENDYGEFGEARLIDLVLANRHLPLDRISETVTAAVYDWIGANEQPDDVTLVLARAR